MIAQADYYHLRNHYLQNPQLILDLEQHYMLFLYEAVFSCAPRIAIDFNRAMDLMPFWINYPPLQRGRAPSGAAIPWLEVGESVIGAHLIRAIAELNPNVAYPGLPSGSDIRFMTQDALVHLDIKVTGPNDKADEIVASPNQLSGDGASWQNSGVVNSPVQVFGSRANMIFQPELVPFYQLEGKLLACLTYFLKGVYAVEAVGSQPLDYLELVCVPNGLLSFTGVNYNETQKGLFIPGKDISQFQKKRVRVRMRPLQEIAEWRRKRIWEREMPLFRAT